MVKLFNQFGKKEKKAIQSADSSVPWESIVVSPEKVMEIIEPGMSIFLATGVAEPRTLVKYLMASDLSNLKDLELIQPVSLGDAIPIDERYSHKYRLRTFFSGWVASEAITAGRIDLIPIRYSRIPRLFRRGALRVDAAFVQVTLPDEAGFCSLGISADVAKLAMERASLVVGEINSQIPRTLGDTFVHVTDFNYLVRSAEDPIYFSRWNVSEEFNTIARNITNVIEDGSCISFFMGPLYEALGKHLIRKRHLGVHSVVMSDALMDLIKSGAVTNSRKRIFRGKSLVTYAQGTRELMRWLDNNPLIEFQGIDIVADPRSIGLNDNFVAIIPARKIDLTGGVALHVGKGNIIAGLGEIQELFWGASLSRGGRTIFALPSRNLKNESNIVLSVKDYPAQLSISESLDMIVTEYGVAYLSGRSVRERALALIDIAHPDDRGTLVQRAKEFNILYRDQIYLTESGHLYPHEINISHVFKDTVTVRFRPIRPSDEDDMRRLFYRFSDQAVYYRYFSPIKTMPHMKMQGYVNVDFNRTMSIVGVVEEGGVDKIIAEGRYVIVEDGTFADTAFIVDEDYQGKGIATFLFNLLMQLARQRGIKGFNADVLTANKAMMKVYEKSPYPMKATVSEGAYELTIPFPDETPRVTENKSES
ncbi:MAG TPA: GNAT family N-acetyltransferase [Deltaproteobacteria bacterium]|nr:GNAT family N-acetyltransferase [Deltaproteobacteria bacterium]